MLHISIMKFFVIYLLYSVFEAQIGKAQFAGGKANLEENSALQGCPPYHGEINANLNVDAGGKNVHGSVTANVTADAWKEYCKCLRKQLEATTTSAPTIKCKDPYEEITEEYGYTYTIYPERGWTRILTYGDIYLYNPLQNPHDEDDANQTITYRTTINSENPLMVYGTVSVNHVPIYTIPKDAPISTCAEYDKGTWDYVVIGIWNLGLTENGTCPQDPATFHISQTLPPMTIMFPEKVPCGKYTIETYETSQEQVFFDVDWDFNIINNKNCTTE